jgi:hypothetical protein
MDETRTRGRNIKKGWGGLFRGSGTKGNHIFSGPPEAMDGLPKYLHDQRAVGQEVEPDLRAGFGMAA